MHAEGPPLQIDMFTGEKMDNRSSHQKKKDRERTAPQQIQMFATPEIIQFGTQSKSAYKDWIETAAIPVLELIVQDLRTPEEVERDLIREAERQTVPMYGSKSASKQV